MKLSSYLIPTIFLGILYFNRNPSRNIPLGDNIVSPADGTIQNISNNSIEIFVGITDVHYQRSPADGEVVNITNLPNIQKPMYNVIELSTPYGHIWIERWAGELAKTVTTTVQQNQYIKKGDTIGRILLGSHVSVTIPPYLSIKIKPYQHLTAGETIIATT